MPKLASPERAAISWAKANDPLAALVSGRVATRLPADPTFPFLRVRLAGGAPDGSDAPTWMPLLTFDCYADTPGAVDDLYRTLIEELESGLHITSHGRFTARVLSARPIPEPDTGWERVGVDSLLFLKP